ncbi:MAG: DUF5694 domain-containing protein [Chthoniobacterales bacterium]
MKYRFLSLLIAVLLEPSVVGFAQTYKPAFDPSHLKGPATGKLTQLLVLGGPHLYELASSFKVDELKPLLDRLAAWKPGVITIEALPGLECDFMRHYPDRYGDAIKTYCWDPAPALAATGLNVPAATAEAERLLAHWPAKPTAAQRRHLAAVLLASGDQASALVQWLRLPEAERHSGEGLDATLVARLNNRITTQSENLLLAAPLAARLGLERVYPVDDHLADSVSMGDEKAYGAAITKAWDNPATDKRKAIDKALHAKLDSPDGLLDLYRAYNTPAAEMLVFKSDLGAALNESSPQQFGRKYVGFWEARNLRMASNIRDVLAAQPGVRALVIVGASHKGYLEAYLNQMHDVQIVDTEKVLH